MTAKKAAVMLEYGVQEDRSRTMLEHAGYQPFFFTEPTYILDSLDREYELFVLGVSCATHPYGPDRLVNGSPTFALIRDLQGDDRARNKPIVIMSTYVHDSLYKEHIRGTGVPAVDIPYEREQLLAAIREAEEQCRV